MYQRKDAFYTRAKREGYRSRAAYKLEELGHEYKLFRPGSRVVDLGAWPGGWMQVAASQVGSEGCVIGIDLQSISPLPAACAVHYLQGDITAPSVLERVIEVAGGPVDLVLSDLAPRLSGVRDRDTANSIALVETARQVARRLLCRGGTLVLKIFMSPSVRPLLEQLRGEFRDVRATKPDATRRGSSELYVVARGFLGRRAAADA